MSSTAELVQKCARALALMEQARRLVDEVLDDPNYHDDPKPRGWPEGVAPECVEDCLPGAIAALTPGWGDNDDGDEPEPARPLRLVDEELESLAGHEFVRHFNAMLAQLSEPRSRAPALRLVVDHGREPQA